LRQSLEKRHIQVTHAGTMVERLEAVRRGEVAAANVMEPWMSVAQKQGFRVLMESNSTRAEAASDDLDGPTLAALFRAQARAAVRINHDPARYAHYFVAEAQSLLEPQDLQTWRLLYGPALPRCCYFLLTLCLSQGEEFR
jgi:NitT/TauT family transport system substrate-binding protein